MANDLRRKIVERMDTMSRRMDDIEAQRARDDAEEDDFLEQLMPAKAPFSDGLEMPKEPLWNNKPPIPIMKL
jgi:hypothetical protein